MNKITKANELLKRLNQTNTITINRYSKEGSKNEKCPFNSSPQNIVDKVRSGSKTGETNKACPIFYTGPPTEKSVCEQRRFVKCMKDQEENACKIDKCKCAGLAPDCSELPDKQVPGRDCGKNIPGCPKIGWERMK